MTEGVFSFSKSYLKGERPTRGEVCTSSGLHSLRPCPRNGASLGGESVLAGSGRAGEVTAGVGRVRSLAFLASCEGFLLLYHTAEPMNF
jgi:hypothetical protein